MKVKKSRKQKHLIQEIIILGLSLFVVISTIIYFYNQNFSAGAANGVEPNTKIAFIGDSHYGDDFKAVLQMIKNENTDIVMHQGDFDYEDNPVGFFTVIADADLDKDGKTRNSDGSLDLDYAYFITEGNHDWDSWPSTCTNPNGCYVNYLKQVFQNLGITPDDPNLDDQNYSITYRGIKMVSTGEYLDRASNAVFADQQLKKDPVLWQVCSQHKTQNALQVGEKPDETGWDLLENCRKEGAIIASAHEHSYSRTKTLTDLPNLVVDPTCPSPTSLCLDKGKTFSFVSGVGGADVRYQKRCLPSTYPYGCNGEWANIYTLNHPQVPSQIPYNEPGVLFIEINVDGNDRKAVGYFKLTNGMVLDNFTIYNSKQLTSPTPTKTPTLTPTKTPTPTPVITQAPTVKNFTTFPSADGFVSSEKPTAILSNQKIFRVKNSPKKIILMRFDLTSLAGKNIKTANLRMNVLEASSSNIAVKLANNSWNPSTVTFNNKPAFSTLYLTFQRKTTGVYDQNFLAVVNANMGKIFTVAFETTGSDELSISSTKDTNSVNKPLLQITYE